MVRKAEEPVKVDESNISFKEGIKNGVVTELVVPEYVIQALSPDANKMGIPLKHYFVYLLCKEANATMEKKNGPALRETGQSGKLDKSGMRMC